MGSWTDTCALSNMPITAGKEVGLLYLRQPYYIRDTRGSDPTHWWIPCTLPLWGGYNSYGGLDFHSHKNQQSLILRTKQWIDNLRFQLTATSTQPESLNWERTELSQDYGFQTPNQDCYLPVLIRRDVWREYTKVTLLNQRGVAATLDDQWAVEAGYFKQYASQIVPNDQGVPATHRIQTTIHRMILGYSIKIDRTLTSEIRDLKLLRELWWINQILAASRQCWQPPTGAGSQTTDYHTQRQLHAIYHSLAPKKDYP